MAGGALYMITRKTWAAPDNAKPFATFFNQATVKYKLPKNLLARVAYQESRFRDDIISGITTSSAGAVGIMQIVPKWHPGVDPTDPAQAIDYAARYLNQLYKTFGTWEKALAAYNWGPANVTKALKEVKPPFDWRNYLPKETQNYINQITTDLRLT